MYCRCSVVIPRLSLGRPSVLGDTVLVGTDDPNSESHFIIVLSVEALEKTRKDPIVGLSRTVQQIRDVRWLSNTTAVCATGKGILQVFNITPAGGDIKLLNSIDSVHTDSIRELAVQAGHAGLVASGGKQKSNHIRLSQAAAVVTGSC